MRSSGEDPGGPDAGGGKSPEVGRRSAGAFAIAFLAVVALGIALDRRVHSGVKKARTLRNWALAHDPLISAANLQDLQAPFVVPEVTDAETARVRHLFWAYPHTRGPDGVAVDFLRSPEGFSSLFPGLPDSAREDAGLWDAYFSESNLFGSEVHSEVVNRGLIERRISVSPDGCRDIMARYGAGAIILGTSETMNSIVPATLHEELAREMGELGPVLLCTRGPWMGDSIRSVVGRLLPLVRSRRAKPARIAIWGLSTWQVSAGGERTAGVVPSGSLFDRFEMGEYLKVRGSELFAPIDWRDVLPLTRGEIQEMALGWSEAWVSGIRGNREAAAGRMESGGISFRFGERRKPDPRWNEIHTTGKCDFPPLCGMPKICDPDRAHEQLETALRLLLAVAERVFVFLPPVSGKHVGKEPPCLRQAIDVALRRNESARVRYSTDLWRDYGIEADDFVAQVPIRIPGETGKRLEVSYLADDNHLAFGGARKFTRLLARRVRDALLHP